MAQNRARLRLLPLRLRQGGFSDPAAVPSSLHCGRLLQTYSKPCGASLVQSQMQLLACIKAGGCCMFRSVLSNPSVKPAYVMSCSQGFAASYVGEYLKDTGTAEKFNVGEYWVDLRCVTKYQ